MKLNFRLKLLAAFFGIAALVGGLIVGSFYLLLKRSPEEWTREILMAAVANTVNRIDPADIKELQGVENPRAHPAFKKIHRILMEIDQAPPHYPTSKWTRVRGYEKDIYILVRTDKPGIGKLLVTINPEEAGRPYDMGQWEEMMAGWDHISADKEITLDEYGRTLSAYAPIRDASGQSIALLGIDAPAEPIEDFRRTIAIAMVLVFAVSLVVAVPPAVLLARRMNRPITMLNEAMDKVAQGHLDAYVEPPRTHDEFDSLFVHFNQMVPELREREQLKRALELAVQIQQQLLPKGPPSLEHFDIACVAQYCDQTGGDYFDFIVMGDEPHGRLGIVVGDVTGHGLPAALLMASTRALVRSYARLSSESLAHIFQSINRHLFEDSEDGHFVTLFFGVLDPQRRVLTWASAGHEPLVCLLRG